MTALLPSQMPTIGFDELNEVFDFHLIRMAQPAYLCPTLELSGGVAVRLDNWLEGVLDVLVIHHQIEFYLLCCYLKLRQCLHGAEECVCRCEVE